MDLLFLTYNNLKQAISDFRTRVKARNSEFRLSATLQLPQIPNFSNPRPCNWSEFRISAFCRPAESRNSVHGEFFHSDHRIDHLWPCTPVLRPIPKKSKWIRWQCKYFDQWDVYFISCWKKFRLKVYLPEDRSNYSYIVVCHRLGEEEVDHNSILYLARRLINRLSLKKRL